MTTRKKRQDVRPPPATETFAVVNQSEDLVDYRCGHLYASRYTLDLYGITSEFDNVEVNRSRCGPCAIERLKTAMIRCAVCGHLIMPGDPVVAYVKIEEMNDARCTTINPGESLLAVAGCVDWMCVPTSTIMYGYWTGNSFRPLTGAFTRIVLREGKAMLAEEKDETIVKGGRVDTADMPRPEQRIFDELARVPAIKVAEVIPGRPKEVVVQWFGETKSNRFEAFQFQFPVGSPIDSVHWWGHPEEFQVIFIGKIRDWPVAESLEEIVECVGRGDAEAHVLWITTSFYVLGGTKEPRAPDYIMPLNVMLADANYGIITPCMYCDLEVLEAANRKIKEPKLTA